MVGNVPKFGSTRMVGAGGMFFSHVLLADIIVHSFEVVFSLMLQYHG
jgi:hypothetical protein